VSELRLDHPEQDVRIGQARAVCANFVIRITPDADLEFRAEYLMGLLDALGLLPGQIPDDMMLVAMPVNRKGEVLPRNVNVGTSFSNAHYS